jgi:predicted dehydrogenase
MIDRRELLKLAPAAAMAAFPGVTSASAGPKIKAGQIGTRHAHAAGKMATMRKLDQLYEVVGVVEPDDKRWADVKNTSAYRGVSRLSEEQLLGTDDLRLVAIETEVRQLVPSAARCVAAGKHVHLDKPAGESLEDFRRLLDAASRNRLTVQMGYMFRYNPAFQMLFRVIRNGWLGEVFEVHGVMSKKVDASTRARLAEYRGGAMFELGCHLIDALYVVMGEAKTITPFGRRTHADRDQLVDNQLAVFEYPRATATIRSSLVEVDGGRRRQFVVCGTNGTAEIKPLEPPSLRLTLDRSRGDRQSGTSEVELRPMEGRYDGDFLDLARILNGEKQPDFSTSHDFAVQRAVLQASGLVT